MEILSCVTNVCLAESLYGDFCGRHAGVNLACGHFEIAFGILTEVIDEIYTQIISDTNKYITNYSKLSKLLEKIEFLGERNYQEIKYCLDLSVNETTIKNDGTIKINRYYYKDAGIIIFNSVYYKEHLIKELSRKMLKYITVEGKKERNRIRDKANKKLKKLKEELFSLIENDPTIVAEDESTEIET